MLTLSGELHEAPIKELPGGLHNVLDDATGTGIWAIDFGIEVSSPTKLDANYYVANIFPTANVVGIDLSPIQPEQSVPSP